MITNKLPGSKSPYKLEAGEGLRYCFGSQLAILIARPEDLGRPMAGAVLSGAKGSSFPLHRHATTHEAWFILEGVVSVVLGDKEYALTPGSYVNIPAGTAHGFTFQDHRSKFVAWTFGGNANEMYAAIGSPYDGTVYPGQGQAVDWGGGSPRRSILKSSSAVRQSRARLSALFQPDASLLCWGPGKERGCWPPNSFTPFRERKLTATIYLSRC